MSLTVVGIALLVSLVTGLFRDFPRLARGADESRGRVEKRMKLPQTNDLLLAEVRESFSMAMNAVTAHKLVRRSRCSGC